MKPIIILIMSLLSTALLSQTIRPLNTHYKNINDGDYLKDTQNQLNPFVGTWVYQQGNKKVTIKLEKLIYYLDIGHPKYYEDTLKGRYKVENGSTVVYSDYNELMQTGDITGAVFSQGYYLMSYFDEPECDLPYDVKIKIDPNNSNRLFWDMEGDGVVIPLRRDCARYSAPDLGAITTIPLHMVLTRQP